MAGLSPRHAQYGLKGSVAEYVVCHLVQDRGCGIEGNPGSRHFDHADITFAVPDCHGVCQADAKTMQNVLKHIGFAVVMLALAKPVF